jgi:hypothetical protein
VNAGGSSHLAPQPVPHGQPHKLPGHIGLNTCPPTNHVAQSNVRQGEVPKSKTHLLILHALNHMCGS